MGRRELEVKIPDGDLPLGTKIRIRRQYLGQSISELALGAGKVKASFVTQIEIGSRFPSEGIAEKVAKQLGFETLEAFMSVPKAEFLQWLADVKEREENIPQYRQHAKMGQFTLLRWHLQEADRIMSILLQNQ